LLFSFCITVSSALLQQGIRSVRWALLTYAPNKLSCNYGLTYDRADICISRRHEPHSGRLRLDGQERDDQGETGEGHDVSLRLWFSLTQRSGVDMNM
jgi:hypothetical protein